VELEFPAGVGRQAFLGWRDATGELHEEGWEPWDPFPDLVERFEAAVAGAPAVPAWQEAVRCLELDDAARRSIEKRRGSLLEYQEASETVGFKGTMTLVGCGLVWVMLMLLFGSYWLPALGWVILPLLVVFLGLQALRYIIPRQPEPLPKGPDAPPPPHPGVPSDAIQSRKP
jgi:hypothetical protein